MDMPEKDSEAHKHKREQGHLNTRFTLSEAQVGPETSFLFLTLFWKREDSPYDMFPHAPATWAVIQQSSSTNGDSGFAKIGLG